MKWQIVEKVRPQYCLWLQLRISSFQTYLDRVYDCVKDEGLEIVCSSPK